MKNQILRILCDNLGKYVSGEELAKQLNVSRSAVWKHVTTLREEGIPVVSGTNQGYMIERCPDLIFPDEIQRKLDTTIIGQTIKYMDYAESTNVVAKEIAKEAKEGTVVIAETQTGGKGRQGRKWISPKGGIWLSLILKPKLDPAYAARVTFLAGLAVAKAIRSLGLPAKIKWPNDVLINGKKVAGILTEMDAELDTINYVIVGMGIDANVDVEAFPAEFREGSTSIKNELNREIDRMDFIIELLKLIEAEYLRLPDFSQILAEWRNLSETIGEWVKVTTPSRVIYGEVVGVNNEGALIIETGDGRLEKILSGNCEHLRTFESQVE